MDEDGNAAERQISAGHSALKHESDMKNLLHVYDIYPYGHSVIQMLCMGALCATKYKEE